MSIDVFINDNIFRNRILDIRKKSGLTQQQVSEITGLSISTIRRIEDPEENVQYRNILIYLDCIGYELNVRKKEDYSDTDTRKT